MVQIRKRYTEIYRETEAPGTPGNPVVVIDAPCGAGKTSWAIDHMQHTEGPFLFVTPFNKEIDNRIVPMLKKQDFRKPEYKPTKRQHLVELLSQHHNIACTHELFRQIGTTAIELIQAGGYTLILDEVMQVLEPVRIGAQDKQMLFDTGALQLQEDRKSVSAPIAEAYLTGKDNRFKDLVRVANHGRLALVNDSLLLWLFPAGIFAAFHKVYNLTYLYEAQLQAQYYRVHGVFTNKMSVDKDNDTGAYELMAYHQDYDAAFRKQLRHNVCLYSGKYNDIGRRREALSKNWYLKARKPVLESMGKGIRGYFRSQGAKVDNVMWSVFSDWEKKTPTNGFANGFLACNSRATNDYRDRSVMAYCCNIFMNPLVTQWFESEGCEINDDAFAASELVQWLCRSRIRAGKPVSLLLPSKRMRDAFKAFVAGAYS